MIDYTDEFDDICQEAVETRTIHLDYVQDGDELELPTNATVFHLEQYTHSQLAVWWWD